MPDNDKWKNSAGLLPKMPSSLLRDLESVKPGPDTSGAADARVAAQSKALEDARRRQEDERDSGSYEREMHMGGDLFGQYAGDQD